MQNVWKNEKDKICLAQHVNLCNPMEVWIQNVEPTGSCAVPLLTLTMTRDGNLSGCR